MLSHTLLKATAVDGHAVAVEALSFLAQETDLMRRFLDVTGIEADGIRQAAAQPGFLVGVLDFVLAHEPTLIAFCQNTAIEPEIVPVAREQLDAGR